MPYEEKALPKQHNSKSPARKEIHPVVEPPVTQASQEQVQRARIDPARLTPADVMALQRTIGNQAVVDLLGRRKASGRSTTPAVQAKLRVGPVGDRYEQEADRVANQVVGQIDAAPDSSAAAPRERRIAGETG